MTATFASLRVLLGDALIAAGLAVHGDNPNTFDGTRAYGGMESDGPDLTRPVTIPLPDVRAALGELPDSSLLSIAATIIAGWKPILLATTGDHTDVDVLIDVLHDRATQFRVVETGAVRPHMTVDDLIDHVDPTRSSRRGE